LNDDNGRRGVNDGDCARDLVEIASLIFHAVGDDELRACG
jgi:hypothetical protein